MVCPKCGHENLPDSLDCLRCGVIFAKIRQGLPPSESVTSEQSETATEGLWPLEPASKDENNWHLWGWSLGLLVMIVWGGKLIFVDIGDIADNVAGTSLLHLVNLPFHEAGHVLFRPFGSFITSLGGTLGQLLIPLVCLVTLLLKTRDSFGAAVCLWWFGENFLDIAPYINDARAGEMPMVGGNFGHSSPYGFHDWEYLLTESGLLHYDHVLAKAAHLIGSLLMIGAVCWIGGLLYRQYRQRA